MDDQKKTNELYEKALASMKKYASHDVKAVIKYSTAGKFIARYDNIEEAAADIKTPDSYVNAWRRIKACCDRRERYAYGFIWQYEG